MFWFFRHGTSTPDVKKLPKRKCWRSAKNRRAQKLQSSKERYQALPITTNPLQPFSSLRIKN